MKGIFSNIYSSLLIFILLLHASCAPNATKLNATEELGRYFFFDTHLSSNNTKSCGSCHDPKIAFTDGYRRSVSPQGENLPHNAPSLLNTQRYQYYDWANPTAIDYRTQMKRPLYGKHPIELGLDNHWESFSRYVGNTAVYQSLLKEITKNGVLTKELLEACIEAYLEKLQSRNAPFDQYIGGDKEALDASAQRGFRLFTSKELKCVQCHMPPDFTKLTESKLLEEVFVNIGLYNFNNEYPAKDRGIMEYTHKKQDNGKFRIPSLRNVALTAPYMHDGSVETLPEVIDIYANGGRGDVGDKLYGNGPTNTMKHKFISGFKISDQEKSDLVVFLQSLTDTTYLQNKMFLNPFLD